MSLFLRQQLGRALDYKDFCLYMHVWLIVSENPKFLSFIRTDYFEDVISPEQILSVLIKQLITIALIKVNQDMYCSQDLFQNSVSIFVHVHLSFSLLILTFILLWFCFSLSFSFNFALSVSSWETGSSPIKFSSVFSISVTFTVCNCPLHWKIFYRKVFYFLSTKKNFYLH